MKKGFEINPSRTKKHICTVPYAILKTKRRTTEKVTDAGGGESVFV